MTDKPESGVQKKSNPLERRSLEVKHSYRQQLVPLKKIMRVAIYRLTRSSKYSESLSSHICDGILNGGNGFLKAHRGLYIKGLQVLGMQARKPDIPKRWRCIFDVLRRLSEKVVSYPMQSVTIRSCRLSDHKEVTNNVVKIAGSTPVFRPPTKLEVEEASLALYILRFPYFVRLELNPIREAEVLQEFVEAVTRSDTDPQVQSRFECVFQDLRKHYGFPKYYSQASLSMTRRTYKQRGSYQDTLLLDRYLRVLNDTPSLDCSGLLSLIKRSKEVTANAPRATVLSEKAGKTRVIVGYDGALQCTDVPVRLRECLDEIPQDCSMNQGKGIELLVSLTKYDQVNKTNKVVNSIDLKAFTDNIPEYIFHPVLSYVGGDRFHHIYRQPIVVNGKHVRPTRLLMGLKGSFEAGSLVHHAIIHETVETDQYALCGDDLVFRGPSDRYNEFVNSIGMQLNVEKSIYSLTLGVFCGTCVWLGNKIKFPTIPLFSLGVGSDPYEVIGNSASLIENYKVSSLPADFIQRMCKYIYRAVGRSPLIAGRFPLPLEIPYKLGGYGLKIIAGGLLRVLDKLSLRRLITIPKKRPVPNSYLVSWCPFYRTEPGTVPFDWASVLIGTHPVLYGKFMRSNTSMRSLLASGAYYKKARKTRRNKKAVSIGLPTVLDVLEFYYFDVPLMCGT